MNASLVAGVDHLLERILERYPVREEYQRYSRHGEHVGIALQNLVFAHAHRVTRAAELIVVALERVVAVQERHGVARFACTRQTSAFQCYIIISRYAVVECLILHREVEGQRVPSGIVEV